MEKRSRRISPVTFEQRDVEDHLCVEVDCSIQPRPLTIEINCGLVNCDPLQRRFRRACNAVSQSMYLLRYCLKRAFYADEAQNHFCLSKQQTGSVKSDSEGPDRRPQKSEGQVCERDTKRLVNVAVCFRCQHSSAAVSKTFSKQVWE